MVVISRRNGSISSRACREEGGRVQPGPRDQSGAQKYRGGGKLWDTKWILIFRIGKIKNAEGPGESSPGPDLALDSSS